MSTDIQKVNWPGWETVRVIGRGSFGTVYEIQREVFGDIEKAALKVISIPQNDSDIEELYGEGYDDESITNTFRNHLKSIVAEYSLMRKLSGCTNIVNCDDLRYVQHDNGFGWDIFIKMELLTPLTKALPAKITEETVIKIARDMCAALDLCKKHDIIHRDIKPQNIFVSANGDYKLGDFGIAKTVEGTMGGTKIGTYKFMAPEVYNNQPYGTAADLYSLGLVLYWLLNERRMPFLPLPPEQLSTGMDEEARNRRLAGEPLPPPAHGSERLKKIVLKACAFDPKERYRSAEEMLAALNREEKPVPPPPPPRPEPPQPVPKAPAPQNPPVPTPKRKNKGILLGLIGIAALTVVLSVLLLRTGGSQTDCSHEWIEADCETAKICEACGETNGDPLGHDWSDADSSGSKTCLRCDETSPGELVAWYVRDVVNLSFNMLIAEPETAFSHEQYGSAYRKNFITVSQFTAILQQLYDNGYILVSLDDFYARQTDAETGENVYIEKELLLPAGKKPIMLTETNVNYYSYMVDENGDGKPDTGAFAYRLCYDGNRFYNEILSDDGVVAAGAYDAVPLLEEFIVAHPDFSHEGARATIAFSGYDGILGYRINSSTLGDADLRTERENAAAVADALRSAGYTLACYTYGNRDYSEMDAADIQNDVYQWMTEITPWIGQVDVLVFARDGDIGDAESYYQNIKFNLLYSAGFRIFLGFGETARAKIGETYVHQNRLTVTGDQIQFTPELYEGLFETGVVLSGSGD